MFLGLYLIILAYISYNCRSRDPELQLHCKNIGFNSNGHLHVQERLCKPFLSKITKDEMVQALFSFTAQDDDEVSFNAGDWITVLDKTNDDWWKGQVHGCVGIFPRNYVSSPALNKT